MTSERVLLGLLRGINVGGNKRVPMEELRAIATGLGFGGVATYIASGNLMLTTARAVPDVEALLEQAIARHFGFEVEVIVREADVWHGHAAASPYPDHARDHPHLLYLGVAKRPVAAGAEAALRRLCQDGEQLSVVGDALWIAHLSGSARSKLTPSALDRAAGSTVTTRNWRTVTKLAELLRSKR